MYSLIPLVALAISAQALDGKRPPLPESVKARLGSAFLADPNGFDSVCLSQDGKTLVTGSQGSFQVWDLAKEQRLQQIQLERDVGLEFRKSLGPVHLISFLDTSNTILVCTESGHFTWDLSKRKRLHFQERKQMARICNSAISGDGNWLAHGDRSGNIVLHDLKKRTFVAFPKKHGDRITALALSSQGKRLLSGDQDGLILLWDTETRKSTQQGKKHESKILDNEIHSLVFSADGKSFYSTCDDGVIKEWSIDSNEKEKRVLATRKDSGIATMALTPDGSRLAWSDGAAICSLDLTGDNKTLKKTQHLSPIRNLCFSLNGKSLAFSTESRTANIIDVKSGSLQFKRNGHDGEVTSMLFLAESDDILTEGSDGRCLHWKSDGVLIGTMAMNQAAFGTFPIVHSRRLIAKLDDKEQAVHFWSNPTLRYHSKISLGKKYPQAFTLLPDGKSVLVADDYVDGKAKSESIVRILDQESGKPVSKFETGLPEILKLQASPNRRKVFIRGQTKSIMIDLGTGKPDFVFEHLLSAGLQHAGEFTPDGKKLVVNYGLDDLWVIDAMSGKRIQPLYESSPVVRRIVTAMSVSPNGKLLAVALSDLGASRSHVDLWDMEKTTVVRTFRGGHEGRINSVCFSASSHFLGSGGADSTAVIWNLQRLPK